MPVVPYTPAGVRTIVAYAGDNVKLRAQVGWCQPALHWGAQLAGKPKALGGVVMGERTG